MPHTARVAHHVRGRIRLKMSNARGDFRALQEIKEAIAPLNGVRKVDVNTATGSIVVHYDSTAHDDFHEYLAEKGALTGAYSVAAAAPPELTEVDDIARKIEAEAEFLSEHSDTAKSVVNFFGLLNREVKRATNNAVDLKVLLPIGLAVYSVLEVGIEASTPMWLTLGIFSFNSFVSLHSHPPKTATQSEEIVVDHPLPEPDTAEKTQTVRRRSTIRSKA
jgi:Heavy metal associated domain 2